ncbi:MAG TPA: COX15/CtaA family protein [Thermomicrobiales bacterium]|jgi:cytochrome c oxidase assembly protein subunit 15
MRDRLRRATKWLAVVTTVGMFVVLVMGSTVTVTGSGEGCGTSWPLCNGQFIPEFAVSTAIEYSHRLVTAVEGVLILGTAIGALAFWRNRREVRVLVPVMVFFLLLQAGLGALAVKFPTSDEVLALHFGISLVAFASVLLTATILFGIDNGRDALRDRLVPRSVRLGAWGLLIYTYGVVYLGAYVNHTDASLACLDWPLCQGSVFPGFTGPVGIVFSHRLAAAFLTLGIGWLFLWCWRIRATRPDLAWASVVALVMLLSQSATGAAVVFSRLNIFSSLSHGAVVTLFFGALAYIGFGMLPRPRAVRGTPATSSTTPSSAARYPAGTTGARIG